MAFRTRRGGSIAYKVSQAGPRSSVASLVAAAGLFELLAADWSRSTAPHWRDRGQDSSTIGYAVSAVAPPATVDIVQSLVIDIPPPKAGSARFDALPDYF